VPSHPVTFQQLALKNPTGDGCHSSRSPAQQCRAVSAVPTLRECLFAPASRCHRHPR
jgi:hypothetical protein